MPPAPDAPNSSSQDLVTAASEAAAANHKGDLLVVDDDESVLLTLQAVLQMDGYNVEARSSGTEAIELIRRHVFDLVLTDLRLDDMDGITILSEIKRHSPETVSIMLTGYASLETAVKALREGAYDYLVKPCDVEELKATVARGIERRHLTRQLHERMVELQHANQTIGALNRDLQLRVDEATASLRERLADLEKANAEIAALQRTTEEHLQQLQELDRLKSQFLSMASHELKTPLTVISGFLQVALRRKQRRLTRGFPSEQEWFDEQKSDTEQLEVLNTQSSKLARLVDELLDVSRIESGRLEFRFGDVDVRQLATDVAGRMQLTTQKHTLSVLPPAPDQETPSIVADRDHLEQVLNNLITNAIKYSPDGGPVEIDVRPDGSSGILLSVKDKGVGIPQSELDAVFSLFYRSRAEGSRQAVSGMGLGLYISKEIVERHGGRIWVESEPGNGSTFFVSLPKEPSAATSSTPPLAAG
jgi:two-component system, sensor histidine kinase and response regulator